ncbi:MAG: DUF1648 domain-containing protein [Lewinellaceae bacterium]|nr:DUF1648 domain-containing protein [Saprospiraceae bacterium]MCB9344001.1 DUF1648 domain-containing protein [Lewinellaceae bacterium]
MTTSFKQPKLNLPDSTYEKILEALAIIFSVGALLLAIFKFSSLPQEIPTHFNASGKADSFGSKMSIFIIPVIAIATCLLMVIISKTPHKFNFLNKITEENAPREYRRARFIVRVVNAMTSLLFLCITNEMIQASEMSTPSMGVFILVFCLAITIAPIIIYIFWPKSNQAD